MFKLYQFVLLKLIIFVCFSSILFGSQDLRLGVLGSFNNFNPYGIIGVVPKDYYLLVYDSLMIEELDDLGNFKPLLAESYKVDGNDIIFYINKKSPMNVEDIIYTFEVIKKYGIPYYKEKLKTVEAIEKQGSFQVKFKTSGFSQSLFNLIVSLPIISKKYWEGEDFLAPSLKIPKTAGAYFIEEFIVGKEIIFKKNPNYWAKNIPSRVGYFNFNKVVYKYVSTDMQLSMLYQKGEINFKERKKSDKLLENDKIFIQKNKYIPPFKAYFLNINDTKIRQAISQAYNFELVKDYFLTQNQLRLQSLFENTSLKDTSFVFSNTADLVKAQKLLGNTKGIKIRFLFRSTEDFKISQDFINSLKKLGFEVTYKIPSYYDYLELRKNRDYEIIVEELLFSEPPQDELISYFIKGGEYNYSNISNVEFENLIKNKKFKDLDLKLKQGYYFIPLYYDETKEYIYKQGLEFKNQDTLDIFTWWHK